MTARGKSSAQDLVAHLAVPVLLVGFVLRKVGERQGAAGLVAAGTAAQFAAVVPVATALLWARIRGRRVSPGVWALLGAWTVTTPLVWGAR
ncbi:hypothetical protein [Streptomyces sp. NPDC089919]|uniref:hypothetical protein n=1 Tax=Streptomyces sp. NPDC089919 TaxID=3155188 RepID=UPI00343246E3